MEFKIIETRTKRIIKYQNQVFRFASTSNTRDQPTLWECAVENCPALLKLNKERNKIIKSNDKHKHSNGGPMGERRSSITSSTSDSSHHSSTSVSRSNSLDENLVPGTEQQDPNVSTETVIASSNFDTEVLLPNNETILSIGTPAIDVTANSSTFNETPLMRDTTKDLKYQIHCLTQEIINKQIQIDRLHERTLQDKEELDRLKHKTELDEDELKRLRFKSEEDDKVIKEMIENIRVLESLKPKKSLVHDSMNKQYNKKNNNQVTQPTNMKKTYAEVSQAKEQSTRAVSRASTSMNITTSTIVRKTTRCVIFGDSHVRNLRSQLEKELPGSYEIHTHFKPGATFQEVANSISSTDLDYEKIFVMAGTNDVCHSTWSEVENAILEISSKFKHTKVFLILVPPRGEKSIMNKYVAIFNKNLKFLVEKVNNLEFIEISYLLNHQDFCTDRLHLNRRGITKLCKKISQYALGKNKNHSSGSHRNTIHNESDQRVRFNLNQNARNEVRQYHNKNNNNWGNRNNNDNNWDRRHSASRRQERDEQTFHMKRKYQDQLSYGYRTYYDAYNNYNNQHCVPSSNPLYNIPTGNRYSLLDVGTNFRRQ